MKKFDEVFAIDGGSTDGTVEVFESYAVPVYRQPRKSLNAAYWHAVEMTRCEHILVFFPKGTLDPKILQVMSGKLRQGYQLVIPTRVSKGGRNEEDDKIFRPRKWGINVLARIASLLWRREGDLISDVLHGVKGFTRSAFLLMRPSESGVTIDLEMVVRAYRLHLARCEFPVTETSRPWNTTHFKLLPTGIRLAKFLWSELWRSAPVEAPAADAAGSERSAS
ncbi:MAG TPA: glycosyltransferase [Bryobacteraceae bacterium]|nr:glycosyltransferase [Bryobacteraceae bacterium]